MLKLRVSFDSTFWIRIKSDFLRLSTIISMHNTDAVITWKFKKIYIPRDCSVIIKERDYTSFSLENIHKIRNIDILIWDSWGEWMVFVYFFFVQILQ